MVYAEVVRMITFTSESLVSVCENINVLRSVNLFGGLVVLPFIVQGLCDREKPQFWAVNIVAMPLLFTYYFLFYTDIWASILIVASLALVVRQPFGFITSSYFSGIVAFASLWFRQTNIIWIAFIASLLIDKRRREHHKDMGFLQNTVNFIRQAVLDWIAILPFIINILLFAIFVKYNEGITFGDKENHKLNLHIVQVFYCLTFIAMFTWPVWLSIRLIKRYIWFTILGNHGLNTVFTIGSWIFIKFIIDNYTVVHPFLLADNRHYTFYIWKRILNQEYSNIFMIPIYHFCTWNIIDSLSLNTSGLTPITIITFIGGIFITIIPSPLFEPRYYIVPLIIYRLYVRPSKEKLIGISMSRHILEFAWLIFVDVTIMVIFLGYEFTWLSEPGKIQRIIW
ncbi:uncharacterized protein AC631_02802 [Debaryomyces fabryi]|uniref:Dol-P-Glc:Glc(2)Man(9)GlcNAc(2)-PP-Dol alpha-1,2-glucosyltransferase n=1 Tax=Debaryomyces fabryi TaxID=58627 RepID=A0A0V1PZT6_9ASCO|nr:uncharacterized protein AC631_02802 [Debaryomyces fabryi]KSA01439.1 hypothetical protein AC631_02802 [Debaryomyces fabryi]